MKTLKSLVCAVILTLALLACFALVYRRFGIRAAVALWYFYSVAEVDKVLEAAFEVCKHLDDLASAFEKVVKKEERSA